MALSIRDYQGLCAEYEEDIEEKNKEIKQLKKEKDDLVLANKGRKALTGAQFSCMKKLEKEKEWLIETWATEIADEQDSKIEGIKVYIERDMQQALKEGNEMDRLDDLKETIKKDKLLPDYIKELALDVLQKIDYFTISLAKSTVGHITLAYFREHQYESDANREMERLRKEREWLLNRITIDHYGNGYEDYRKKEFEDELQQALKGE